MGLGHTDDCGSHTWQRETPLKDGCPDQWTWNEADKSPEVMLVGDRREIVHFHPNWSNGTAGVRGSKGFSRSSGIHYWEISVMRRVFGTSMMFGLATLQSRLHVDAFVNLLGEDEHSWALSHKGLLWHRGECRQYIVPFRENETTVIGMLFDGPRGTLTYFQDGLCLGVAFTGLDQLGDVELFPAICSTAAKTQMVLGRTFRSFDSLQDRCRAAVVKCLKGEGGAEELPLPTELKRYISHSVPVITAQLEAGAEHKLSTVSTRTSSLPQTSKTAACILIHFVVSWEWNN